MAPVRRSERGKRKIDDREPTSEETKVQDGIEKLKAARLQKEKKSSSSGSASGSQSPDSSGEKTIEEEVDLSKLTKREFLNRGPLMFVISLGMKEINKTKPADPVATLGEFLMQYKDLHKNPDWKNVIPTDHYSLE